MSYLYLNFSDNLEQGSKNWDDFYTTSLKEQFEVINRKLNGSVTSIQEFLSYAFPIQTAKNYFISMPSFDRRIKQNRRGVNTIYNIVIRPERDQLLNQIISSRYDLIIIGMLLLEIVLLISL